MSTDRILVTGAFGLVGAELVRTLLTGGHDVVATDLDNEANHKKAARLSGKNGLRGSNGLADRNGLDVRWADLTDPAALNALVSAVRPAVIVHLAAVIPPACYARPDLARKVNVTATQSLVDAAVAQPSPPRFIQASSVAVYGPRNPDRVDDVLTPDMAPAPSDLYGAHKAEAEKIVTASHLDWVILRLGGVLTAEPRWDIDKDLVYFEGLLPTDGRIQTVDVRDVAHAFAAAATGQMNNKIYLIGGDESHRITQGFLAPAVSEAMGLTGGLPIGRPGNPDSDRDWFATDWMDTSSAQAALGFQRHTLADLIAETRDRVGVRRYPLRVIAPAMRRYLRGQSPYRHTPGRFADPWGAIASRWGNPSPDSPS
ncbi:MAG: oxidoreductase [Gordonia sp. (in: high G+C Gram-positive bacteria)]|nr:MAG: oxidoreductase [Gordonia sp. (in: high G+C Gram-positive bacteria)]